jgi:hypothetical protein
MNYKVNLTLESNGTKKDVEGYIKYLFKIMGTYKDNMWMYLNTVEAEKVSKESK